METNTQYYTYEGKVGATSKTVTIPLKRVESISITNDGTDRLQVKFARDGYNSGYIRTIKANEVFSINAAFDQVTFISPDTGETNDFRMFVLGE